MSAVTKAINKQNYQELVARALPRVLHTEEENERCIAELEQLRDHQKLTPEEQRLAELMVLLIEDFENSHYRLESPSPVEVVQELMEANGLKQADLLDVFGTRSVVSEVLNGKRDLSKAHIQKLSKRFHVSPEIFFSPINHARYEKQV